MTDYENAARPIASHDYDQMMRNAAEAQKAAMGQPGGLVGGYASGVNQAKPAVLSITLQEMGERLQKLAGLSADMADRVRGPQAENMLADSLVGVPEASDLNAVASRLLRTVDRIERNVMRALNAL